MFGALAAYQVVQTQRDTALASHANIDFHDIELPLLPEDGIGIMARGEMVFLPTRTYDSLVLLLETCIATFPHMLLELPDIRTEKVRIVSYISLIYPHIDLVGYHSPPSVLLVAPSSATTIRRLPLPPAAPPRHLHGTSTAPPPPPFLPFLPFLDSDLLFSPPSLTDPPFPSFCRSPVAASCSSPSNTWRT